MDIQSLMKNPQMAQMIQQAAQKKRKPSLMDLLNGKGSHGDLAEAFPKIESMMQQQKLANAKKKAQDLAFKQLHDRAKQAYEMLKQQREMQAQQQQIQAARNSV